MQQSGVPAPHLVQGLRRLVGDLGSRQATTDAGLSEVVCGHTNLIHFGANQIKYCHEPVDELAAEASFESVVWLLLHGQRPGEEQLADCCSVLADAAVIDGSAASMFDKLPLNTPPLSAFPLCLSLQKYYDPAGLEVGLAEARSRVWRILAQLPLHLSAILNHDPGQCGSERTGLADHELELSWAGRLLSRIRGGNARPTPAEEAAMNVLLICECLTEMRPACFAARFVASTTRNVLAALETAATVFVSQLKKDPFQWTSDLLIQFRDPAQAEAWWRRREGQPMPFGFTPLTGDPRPGLLTAACRTLLGSGARIRLEASAARLEALQAGEHLWPTTDWTAARLMTLLGIPADRQSLVVASARLAGWAAQALEQQASGVSLLPALRYDVPDAPESEFPEAAAG